MTCNKNMLNVLENLNLRRIAQNEEYKIIKKEEGGDNALFIWKMSDGRYCTDFPKINATQSYLSKIERFIGGPIGLFVPYEWYANELYIKSDTNNIAGLLEKGMSIYYSWKQQMVTKFYDIPFDIWISLEYDNNLKVYTVLLTFNALHASTHYVRPDAKVLDLFKDKAIMMETVNDNLNNYNSNNNFCGSIIEEREELTHISQKSDMEKNLYLQKHVGYVTGSYPAMNSGICHNIWFHDKCPRYYDENILSIIEHSANLEDDMDYRNILMMLAVCKSSAWTEFINRGLNSPNEEIVESVTRFAEMDNASISNLGWYKNCIKEYEIFCDQYRLKEDWNGFE